MTDLLPPAIRRQVMNLEAVIGHYTRHPAPWSNDVVTKARSEIAEIYDRDDERMASGKAPVDVAIRGAAQIRAALTREEGE